MPDYGLGMAVSGPATAIGALPDGRLIAGSGEQLWLTDRSGASESVILDYGPAKRRIRDLRAIAVSRDGRIAIADAGGNRVWEVAFAPRGGMAAGAGTTATAKFLAGTGTTFYPIGDGAKAVSAQLDAPAGVAWLPDGSLLISDTGHGRVRKVGTDGRISTIAGTSVPGPAADGGSALRAFLAGPGALAVGPQGTAIVAETGEPRVRRITPDGTISTLARISAAGLAIGPEGAVYAAVGNDIRAFWDGGEAMVQSGLHWPKGLAALPDGALAVADGDRVVYLEPAKSP